mmetsp:Transcript_121171/g.377259  ORF Transcript_121171/g.377259 Transcript_121171/m.377259 type:complete len:294 (-) Transcript_121171:1330-2211(-)
MRAPACLPAWAGGGRARSGAAPLLPREADGRCQHGGRHAVERVPLVRVAATLAVEESGLAEPDAGLWNHSRLDPPDPVLALCDGLADELPQVLDVLDRGRVGAPEGDDDLHEVGEGELALVVVVVHVLGKDDICKVHEADDVNIQVMHGAGGLLVLDDLLELLLRYVRVAILVQHRVEDLHELRPGILHGQVLSLCGRHSADDLAQHADQHVHDRQRGDEEEHVQHEHQRDVLLVQGLRQPADLVQQGTLDPQRVHADQHRREVGLPDFCALGELIEGDGKDVQDHPQQQQHQ